eukprot:1149119-Pelagomonas_calceolata.AAC.5
MEDLVCSSLLGFQVMQRGSWLEYVYRMLTPKGILMRTSALGRCQSTGQDGNHAAWHRRPVLTVPYLAGNCHLASLASQSQ